MVERTVEWERGNRRGTVRIELFPIGRQAFISFKRASGCRPPARLLGYILTSALGPAWWFLTPAKHEVRVRESYSGRVSVRCRGQRSSLRIDRNGGVHNFFLPADGLTDLIGPAGIGGRYATADPIQTGYEYVRRA